MSAAEDALARALEANPIPGWDLVREYRFDPTRKWKFDFAFPSQKLAVEVEGQYHRTYAGHRNDCEKFRESTRQGWRVLRFQATTSQRRATEWAAFIREFLLCSPPSAPSSVPPRASARRARPRSVALSSS